MSKFKRELSNMVTIASKEFMDNVMSKRFIFIAMFYIGLSIVMAGVVVLIFYSNLSVFNNPPSEFQKYQMEIFLQDFQPDMVLSYINLLNIILALLAVFVASDSISLEKKDRTIFQLMSKPVDRSSIIIGKFLGNLAVVSSLFLAGSALAYLITAILTGRYPEIGHLPAVVMAILSMILLLSVYVALGIIISTVTKNPFISIVSSLLAWMGLWFTSTIGNVIGDAVVYSQSQFILGTDTFDYYPIYAKILVWLDPLSHGIMQQVLDPNIVDVAAGLPLWVNVIVLLAYAGILLVGAIGLFDYQDL